MPTSFRPPSQPRGSAIILGWMLTILALLMFVQAILSPATISRAQEDEPGTGSSIYTDPNNPRLNPPVLPENPSLADLGAQKYWGVCMACHGDTGQGLTDEWREAAFGEDNNCWTSKCHASNHPPQGFEFPRFVPAVLGPGTLARFTTASELQAYLLKNMPWWDPGTMSEDEAWQLTAYLLRENGILPETSDFNPKNAALTPVHLIYRPQGNERVIGFILAGILGLAAALSLVTGKLTSQVEQADRQPHKFIRPNFLHHLHPPSIPAPQARWRYTLSAGGLAVFLSLVLGITGTLEMFFYIPTTEQAGQSIQTITFLVPYGALVRSLHFWAAQALMIVTLVHLVRVVFTGAYVSPRRFNFLLGLGLLVIALFMNFTGYVLRWDEGIRWALVVGTNLLKTIPLIGQQVYGAIIGGSEPGQPTLIRFYAWHIFGLTIIAVIFGVWHLFKVRRDGGISAPPPDLRSDPSRISRFELVRREVLAMLVAGAVLVLISLLIPPPLAAPIQDAGKPLLTDVRAPWFFLWIQQLLRIGDAFLMGIVVPIIGLSIIAFLPFIFSRIPENQKGKWFPRAGRIAQIITAIILSAWLVLTILEYFNKG